MLKNFFLIFSLIFCISGCAADMNSSYHERYVTGENMDFSFKKERPYVKTKNRMDLSAIKKNEDLIVVKEAINQISRFFVQLSFVPVSINTFSDMATKNGIVNIKFPPKNNQYNYYLATRIFDWMVHDPATISLTVEFRGVPDKDGPYFDKFIFVKENGVWLFDRRDL